MTDGLVPIGEMELRSYPPQPRLTVQHATLIYEDERNAAKTVHGIGYRGACSCGERSRVYATHRMARAWNLDHARTHPGVSEGTDDG